MIWRVKIIIIRILNDTESNKLRVKLIIRRSFCNDTESIKLRVKIIIRRSVFNDTESKDDYY